MYEQTSQDFVEKTFLQRLDLLDQHVREGNIISYEIENRKGHVMFLLKMVKARQLANIDF